MSKASKAASASRAPKNPTSAKRARKSAAPKTSRPATNSEAANGSEVQVLSSKVVFNSKVFSVTSDEIIEPSGIRARRDIIRHPGSVVILGIDERKAEPSVLLIRQYRYAAGQELWELPAGRIDEGENALEAAKRELLEETGYTASEWVPALYYYASPGFLDETMTIFAARDLRRGKATPEEDESIVSRLVPLTQAVQWVMAGKMQDGKAIAGVLWAAQKFHIVAERKVSKRR
jgi:ADP-ribose diphosphatase